MSGHFRDASGAIREVGDPIKHNAEYYTLFILYAVGLAILGAVSYGLGSIYPILFGTMCVSIVCVAFMWVRKSGEATLLQRFQQAIHELSLKLFLFSARHQAAAADHAKVFYARELRDLSQLMERYRVARLDELRDRIENDVEAGKLDVDLDELEQRLQTWADRYNHVWRELDTIVKNALTPTPSSTMMAVVADDDGLAGSVRV